MEAQATFGLVQNNSKSLDKEKCRDSRIERFGKRFGDQRQIWILRSAKERNSQ
jgi:hypothetical protein